MDRNILKILINYRVIRNAREVKILRAWSACVFHLEPHSSQFLHVTFLSLDEFIMKLAVFVTLVATVSAFGIPAEIKQVRFAYSLE